MESVYLNPTMQMIYKLLHTRQKASIRTSLSSDRYIDNNHYIYCIASRKEIAEQLNISIKTVYNNIKKLVKIGLIREERAGRGLLNRIYVAVNNVFHKKENDVEKAELEEDENVIAETVAKEKIGYDVLIGISNKQKAQKVYRIYLNALLSKNGKVKVGKLEYESSFIQNIFENSDKYMISEIVSNMNVLNIFNFESYFIKSLINNVQKRGDKK